MAAEQDVRRGRGKVASDLALPPLPRASLLHLVPVAHAQDRAPGLDGEGLAPRVGDGERHVLEPRVAGQRLGDGAVDVDAVVVAGATQYVLALAPLAVVRGDRQ